MKYPAFEGVYDGKEVWSVNPRRKIKGIHPEFKCTGPTCVLHKPTNHHMREFPLVFRRDLRTFERICEHQVTHPDPDCRNAMADGVVHECCSMACCVPVD